MASFTVDLNFKFHSSTWDFKSLLCKKRCSFTPRFQFEVCILIPKFFHKLHSVCSEIRKQIKEFFSYLPCNLLIERKWEILQIFLMLMNAYCGNYFDPEYVTKSLTKNEANWITWLRFQLIANCLFKWSRDQRQSGWIAVNILMPKGPQKVFKWFKKNKNLFSNWMNSNSAEFHLSIRWHALLEKG